MESFSILVKQISMHFKVVLAHTIKINSLTQPIISTT
jgi:hypothetical protein